LAKHSTQRSYSLHWLWAHLIRTLRQSVSLRLYKMSYDPQHLAPGIRCLRGVASIATSSCTDIWMGVNKEARPSYSRCNVCGAHIADVFNTAFAASRGRLLSDDAHDGDDVGGWGERDIPTGDRRCSGSCRRGRNTRGKST